MRNTINFAMASFLITPQGGFDYGAALISLYLVFGVLGLAFVIVRALKSGHILLILVLPRGGSMGRFVIEREKSPSGFWCVVVVYCLSMLLLAALAIAFCFGLFRSMGQ